MNAPTPAIVTRAGARRLPRVALLLLCLAYGLAGFVGRDAWKSADMAALGLMVDMAQGATSWWSPSLAGIPPDEPALLPYWLGAWAIQMAPTWVAADFVARIPFMLLLALAMTATWYGTYYLARAPLAQPVAFAFGGEARPTDYARAIADGAVLALVACLGLAQLAHETTPALAQLAFASLLLFAAAALNYHRLIALGTATTALLGLALSGAPWLAAMLGGGAAVIQLLDAPPADAQPGTCKRSDGLILVTVSGIVLALCTVLDMLRWKLINPFSWALLQGHTELLIWFTWPAWPLTLWTLWRWRRQLHSRHLALPIWFVVVPGAAAIVSDAPDRNLLLALPGLACLAAFALPTLKRQFSALIDWFTLLFFSSCVFIVWVVWIAMQTGVPAQPAANVARLAPGFVPDYSASVVALAVLATAAWGWLVRWRVGRHRAAIWKSLVLPAGGVAVSLFLALSLWMPLLNYAQSYNLLVRRTLAQINPNGTECVEFMGLSQGQIAAFKYYGKLSLQLLQPTNPQCPWLLVEPKFNNQIPISLEARRWEAPLLIEHPANAGESVLLLKRR